MIMFVLQDASSLNKMIKYTDEERIRVFNKKYSGEYNVDFSKADFNKPCNEKVELLCKKHNKVHYVTISSITDGSYRGCELCVKERKEEKLNKIREQNIKDLSLLIEKEYPGATYDLNNFISIGKKFKIVLPTGECKNVYLNQLKEKYNIKSDYRSSKNIAEIILTEISKKFPNIDTSNFVYVNLDTPVQLRCTVHNKIIEITPRSILTSINSESVYNLCEECNLEILESIKTEWFKKTFRERHPNLDHIDLSNVRFISLKETPKVTLKCLRHNLVFEAYSGALWKEGFCGCPECANEARRETVRKEKENKLKESLRKEHPELISDYVHYEGNLSPIKLICRDHLDKEFYLTPWQIKYDLPRRGYSDIICPFCLEEKRLMELRENFIKKAKEIHGDHYDYSNIVFINWTKPVTGIICNKCGRVCEQDALNHLRGYNCCSCYKNEPSIGEKLMRKWFNETESLVGVFEYQHKISVKSLLYKNLNKDYVFIDGVFIQKDKEYWIEIQGKQHYDPESSRYFGLNYEKQIIRDESIRRHCRDSGIILIEISYKYDTFEKNVFHFKKNNLRR